MPSDGDSNDDGDTTSTATRYKYTNDIIAFALIAFAIGATAVYLYRGKPVPIWLSTVDSLAVVTAVVWAFGKGAFKAAKKAIAGGGKK